MHLGSTSLSRSRATRRFVANVFPVPGPATTRIRPFVEAAIWYAALPTTIPSDQDILFVPMPVCYQSAGGTAGARASCRNLPKGATAATTPCRYFSGAYLPGDVADGCLTPMRLQIAGAGTFDLPVKKGTNRSGGRAPSERCEPETAHKAAIARRSA